MLGASEVLPHDADCNESMMKKGFTACKNETWEEYKETLRKKMKASQCAEIAGESARRWRWSPTEYRDEPR